MDYSEKYKTVQWQQKKCEILVRDNFTCQVCGFSSNDDANSSKLLHVHHRYYIKGKDEVWDYPNEALITLCEDCHAKEHSFDGKSIQDAMQNALNSGVLGVEIVETLNNMANKMKCHLPKNQSFLIPNKKAASRTTTTKQNTLPVQIRTSKLHKTKKELLDELAIYANQYNADYLQEFIDYWFEYTDEKGGILRCHSDENFFIPTYIVDWKRKREEVISKREYEREIILAISFANENYDLYNETFQIKLNKTIEQNRAIIDQEKKLLLKEFESKIPRDILLSTINPKIKSKITVFEYLTNTKYPVISFALYRDCVGHGNLFKFYEDSCSISNGSLKKAGKESISLIEDYFKFSLTKHIEGIRREVRYKIPQQVYIERCKQVYLKKYSQHYINLDCKDWGVSVESEITIEEFELLYVTNQILRQNASDIISSIEKLDEDISLCDFCKDIDLESICADKKLTLKSYLKSYINSFDPYVSFNPILIKPGGILIKIWNNNTIPMELMKKLNAMYNMGFIEFQLKIDDRMKINEINGGYISSTWGFVQENDLIPPLEILTEMDGFEFDFCAERFYNGTMKLVTIPDDAFKKDPIYYLEKVQELVTKYEKALIGRKSKS